MTGGVGKLRFDMIDSEEESYCDNTRLQIEIKIFRGSL